MSLRSSRSRFLRLEPAAADVLRYASAGLFVERARAAHAETQLTSENAGRIAGICRRLDGLSLVIELAARVRLLPLRTLLSRLSQRFSVLTGGPRDLPDGSERSGAHSAGVSF
jgi:predicted ATPase